MAKPTAAGMVDEIAQKVVDKLKGHFQPAADRYEKLGRSIGGRGDPSKSRMRGGRAGKSEKLMRMDMTQQPIKVRAKSSKTKPAGKVKKAPIPKMTRRSGVKSGLMRQKPATVKAGGKKSPAKSRRPSFERRERDR